MFEILVYNYTLCYLWIIKLVTYISQFITTYKVIRNYIPLSIAIIISSSYILPIFDYKYTLQYPNNILFNIPAYKLNKL